MSSVREVRRYPVKSMGGESLAEVPVDGRGLLGDRLLAVRDGGNRLASGKNTRRFRRRDAVFDFRALTSSDGVVVERGAQRWSVGDPQLDAALTSSLGADVRIAVEDDIPHQDRGAISMIGSATLSWCEGRWGLDADPRRLRPNLVLDTDEPFVEETWVGREVVIGSTRLRVTERTPRCRMIDVAQDGAKVSSAWLSPLTAIRGMYLGVYADVVRPGVVRLGDRVLPA